MQYFNAENGHTRDPCRELGRRFAQPIGFLLLIFLLLFPASTPAAVLKNVQSGTLTLANGSASATVTISSVDITKTFLVFSSTANSADPKNVLVTGQMTDSTTLTFQRVGTSGDISIRWHVAEFSSGVRVQRGSQSITVTTHTVSFSSIDTAKSFPLITYRNDGTTFSADDLIRAEITGSTTMDLSHQNSGTSGSSVVEWQVIEFTGASVENGNVSFATSETSKSVTVSSMDLAKTWLVYSYNSSDSQGPSNQNNIAQKLVRGRISNSTTLVFDRDGTDSSINLKWYLLRFSDGTKVQHNSQSFTSSETSKNVTINSVDLNKSIALGGKHMRGGKTSYSSADNPGPGWATFGLTSSTNLQITRALHGSSTADFGWFVTTFSTCSAAGSGTFVEAENFTGSINQGSGTFTVESSQAGYSGTGYLKANGGGTDASPVHEGKQYRIDFPETGTYKVWVRARGADGASDSLFIGLNGSSVGALNLNGVYGSWVWTNTVQSGAGTINIASTGTHTVNLWIREPNLLIDGIYLTKGAETPSGTIPSGAAVIDPTLCTTPEPNSISGRIFEDADFAGIAANWDGGTGDKALGNVDVELYDNANTYIASRTTASDGTYTFWNIANGTYKVRARSATVGDADTTPHGGLNGTVPGTLAYPLPEMTWGNGSALYGGQNANTDDTATGDNAGPGDTYVQLTASGSGAANVNFGFAYNLIVNTGEDANPNGSRSRQGSLRQFLKNANAIGAANGTTANTSQFRIPAGALTAGKAVITTADYLHASDTGTVLDGQTQIANMGDTNGGQPVIVVDGGGGAARGILVNAGSVQINKLEVRNVSDNGIILNAGGPGSTTVSNSVIHDNGAGLFVSTNGNIISGNTIYNHQAQGVYVEGTSANNIIELNTFYNNAIATSAGLQLNGGSSNIVRKNLFKNEARHGIVISSGDNNKILQNTVHNSGTIGGPDWDGIQVWSGTGNIVKNNIATNNSRYGIGDNNTGAIIDYNVIYANGTSGCYASCLPNSANITVDPKFTNAAAGDFTLQATSPAINRGIDLGADQPDMNGVNPGLYNGAEPDMGAFESSGTSTCVVTTTSDLATAASGSLRYCMTYANANPGTTISFSIGYTANQSSGADSWWRITPGTALPTITANGTVIDGSTQTITVGDTNSLGPEIEIRKGAGTFHGITINSGSNSVRSLVINSFSGSSNAGIYVTGASATGNSFTGNYLGTNHAGTAAAANDYGIFILNGAQNNTVGGSTAAERNLISGNGNVGVYIYSSNSNGNVIKGNYIGTNAAGTAGVANGIGVLISNGPQSNLVGGTTAGEGNLIAYNTRGVALDYTANSDNNKIQMNVVRNNASHGINIVYGNNTKIYHNTVHGNGGDGIRISATVAVTGTVIKNNSITGNTAYGINRLAASMTEAYNLVTDASTVPANGSGRSNVALSGTSLNANPLYVNAAAFNFSLTECTSPSINSGVDLAADQPDLNGGGAGSFNGYAPDLGALEAAACSLTLAGTVYTDEGATGIGAGKTVRVLVNGINRGSAATAGGGTYSITTTYGAGDALLVYVDGNDGATADATTVTVAPAGNLSGIDLYVDHLVARHDNAGSLTNALLNTAKGAYADTEILYSVSGGNLTVSGSGTELYLSSGHSFSPGGAVTTPALKSLGTFGGGAGSIAVNGSLTVAGGAFTATSGTTTVSGNLVLSAGSFSHNNGSVTLNGTGQSLSGSFIFKNLSKSVASADTLTFAAGSTTTVEGTLTLQGAAGQLLTLASSSPGTRWNLVLPAGATKSISYVSVSWSDASGSDAAHKPLSPPNSADGGNTIAWFGVPSLTVIKSASSGNANPGTVVTYTVQISNSGNGSAKNVILENALSQFVAFSLDAFGAGVRFEFVEGSPASGLSLGSPTYSDDGGSTWTYVPASGGGGAPAGYDGAVTNWRMPMSGEMPAGSGFSLRYKVRVE